MTEMLQKKFKEKVNNKKYFLDDLKKNERKGIYWRALGDYSETWSFLMTSAFADCADKDFGSDGVLLARRSANKKTTVKVAFLLARS